MTSVFSHIIQKRFSQVNEDVATDALAYILQESESARYGFLKLLRGIEEDLPELKFVTQQSEDNIRPDMWGMDGDTPRIFVENKFWAGLTVNQPVSYLKMLARGKQPTVLLVNAPEARRNTIWRELQNRLSEAGISYSVMESAGKETCTARTSLGPIISVTSWSRILSSMEIEASQEKGTLADIAQLRSLCESADSSAFTPLTSEDTSDQRIPALVLGVLEIIESAIQAGETQGFLSTVGVRQSSTWTMMGRYIRFFRPEGSGVWIGLNFALWKQHGLTPVWLIFSKSDPSFPEAAQARVEAWASKQGLSSLHTSGGFILGVPFPIGVEKDTASREMSEFLREVSTCIEETTAPME